MTASVSLIARLTEVEASLRAIRKLEGQQRRNKRPSSDLAELISASRASIYIIVYNSIEASIRSILKSIREQIETQGLHFSQVQKFWCIDALQARFLSRMQDGSNHGNLLIDMNAFHAEPLSWEQDGLTRMLANGNFGREAAWRLKSSLNLSWSAPPHTLGGDDLDSIRLRRNALAHGLETFKEVGSTITADDLERMLGRVRLFMVSFMEAVERYRDIQGYIA